MAQAVLGSEDFELLAKIFEKDGEVEGVLVTAKTQTLKLITWQYQAQWM